MVEAVNCHARSLVLLAPYISKFGVQPTTDNLNGLMADLHKKYPNERERSLFASVELSLRRLSPETRQKIKPLGVFQGGADLFTLTKVLELADSERDLLVRELVQIGLAEPMPYRFLRFDPALCPYLWQEMDEATLATSKARWVEGMLQLSVFLSGQLFKDAQLALNLTTLELPNLMRLLEYVQAQGDLEKAVYLATKFEQLIATLGRKHLLSQVVAIREAEAKKLGDWSHTRFESSRMQIERLLDSGNFPQALNEAQALLDKCLQAGETAYSEVAYDIAGAYLLLGRVMSRGGAAETALRPINEAYKRFQLLADQGNTSAAGMAAKSLTEKGDSLKALGRFDEAAVAYKTGIKISEDIGDSRGTAVKKGQLGTVRMYQRRYEEALKAYDDALKIFENLGEPASIAVIWHQIGMVHEEANQFEAAEHAYRQSLAIDVQQNNRAGEASSLDQLGILYHKLNRLEEAVAFHKKAADIRFTIKDQATEGRSRNNLSVILIKLKRYDEAREEILRAIECDKPYGHAAEPWKTWRILCYLEQAVGNQEAADRAREQAIQSYLAYRQDGGENYNPGGRLCAQFWQAIQENKTEEMAHLLSQLATDPQIHPSSRALISKLQAILAGSRDPILADDPELRYTDVAEILFLLEKLGESSS
ncbi:MAG: tetratricopeptide repeat protein [Candidatus Zixiibacteriota bacterium]